MTKPASDGSEKTIIGDELSNTAIKKPGASAPAIAPVAPPAPVVAQAGPPALPPRQLATNPPGQPPSGGEFADTATPSAAAKAGHSSISSISNISQSASGGTPSGDRYTKPNIAMQEPAEGTRIHHYEIIRLLGRGGMGSVFLARDTRLGRRVAIKFLRSQSADLTKRFILEARTTAACSHENIVVIFEVDAWQGSPFMVFEYLQGQTLTRVAPSGKVQAPPRAVELMMPVVKALAFAHSQGIVHRDLKPDNIFITDTGLTKVLDFGIAKVLQGDEKAPEALSRPRAPKKTLDDEDDSQLTQHGAMMGTLSYMSPEQWGNGVAIDHRSDIWAVGIMLFRMLAGKHPLDPLTGYALSVTGDMNQVMPSLGSMAPDVPKELVAVVDKCLLKQKDQRWPDAVALMRALEPFMPGRFTGSVKLDEAPYTGLSSFQETDADRFFGRRLEVAALVNRIRELPMIGVVGSSGAGKSSFVRAGLVPALKRSGEAWESLVLRPGRNPLAALANLVAPMVGSSTSIAEDVEDQKKIAARVKTEPGYVGSVLRARARRDKKKLLIFVDQFEELYTLVNDPAERKAFTSALAAIADDPTSPTRLVLSIRSDFLDRIAEDQRFMAELSQGLVFLAAPGIDGLKEAIVLPAEQAGYRFESPQIVDDMLRHLSATQGALPLLQFAALKLWEHRDPGRKLLTSKGYETIGGVAGALATHADAVLSRVPPQHQPLVRAIMLRLVTPEHTRAIVNLDELRELSKNPQEIQGLIDELVQARLLVVQTGSGQATVELVHESLLHSWPALKRWLEESSEDASFIEQLRQAARQWTAKGQAEDLLWRGELAEEAARFQRRFRGELPESHKAFLDATVDLTQKQAKRKRALTVGAVVFLTALLVAALFALVVIQGARGEAQRQADVAVKAANQAKLAEAEAKANLETAKKAQAETDLANKEIVRKAEEIVQGQKALEAKEKEARERALEAERARMEAERQRGHAVNSAAEAKRLKDKADEARKQALTAREEAERLLDKESKRVRELERTLGGSVMDHLK